MTGDMGVTCEGRPMLWDKTERARFCRAAEARQTSMLELCELYGVSEKWAYKWLARWREGGEAALADRSRRPSSNSRAIDEITAERLVTLRIKHPRWGARKLLAWLAAHSEDREWPAASTVTELLERRGLVRLKLGVWLVKIGVLPECYEAPLLMASKAA